jgi:hypothetical protein
VRLSSAARPSLGHCSFTVASGFVGRSRGSPRLRCCGVALGVRGMARVLRGVVALCWLCCVVLGSSRRSFGCFLFWALWSGEEARAAPGFWAGFRVRACVRAVVAAGAARWRGGGERSFERVSERAWRETELSGASASGSAGCWDDEPESLILAQSERWRHA